MTRTTNVAGEAGTATLEMEANPPASWMLEEAVALRTVRLLLTLNGVLLHIHHPLLVMSLSQHPSTQAFAMYESKKYPGTIKTNRLWKVINFRYEKDDVSKRTIVTPADSSYFQSIQKILYIFCPQFYNNHH